MTARIFLIFQLTGLICASCIACLADSPVKDTVYYESKKRYLNIALAFTRREYNIRIDSPIPDSFPYRQGIIYSTDVRNLIGLIIDWDKLTIGFNFKYGGQNPYRFGPSTQHNFGLQLSNNKFLIEGAYKFNRGYYDKNSPSYIQDFDDQTPYFQVPSLFAQLYSLKGLYFINHRKFSYKSAYGAGFRQVHSAWSPVFSVGYYNEILSADTNFISEAWSSTSTIYSSLKRIKNNAVIIGAGASVNLVLA